MNVVQREKRLNSKTQSKFRNELVRKDTSIGIRGATSLLPPLSYNSTHATRLLNNAPRYQFNNEPSTSKKSSMGPPMGPPRSTKRKFVNSSSTKAESQSSGPGRGPRVLASDSAAVDSDFCTPRNRPTALRYISSSSRGGYSGTRSARSTSTSAVDASVILAISEGRGMARGEIGIAAVDLRHPHLVLCQFSDTLLYTHTMTKINYFNPVEIIVPHTFCEGVKPNQLYQLIRDQYPLVNLTTVQRRHFNDAAGRQQIQTLCAPQYNAVYLQVLHKFYALTAAAAVLKYVEYIQCIVFARESLKIEYHSSENTMIIDVGTATQLELVQPLVPSAGPTCCLLGVLGPTYTVGGIRALRAAILQPSCNLEFIENRLDAVQDLIENESGLMTGLQDVIKKLSDVDKILLLCVESQNKNADKVGEAQLNQTLLLKTTMDIVPNIVEALSVATSGRLMKIKLDFENPHYKEITDRIRNIIQEDAHVEKGAMGSLQRCFAVKPDINGLLDVARRTYSELIEDIQKIVEQLSETYDLPIHLNQNVMKGFHIVLPIAPKNRRSFNIEDLPPIFIQVQNSGASVTMSTEELVVLDHQAKESLNEIQKMSNIVISSLLKELRPFMSSLYKLCENVAELDILLAMAQASTIGSYIRPEFNNYMDIKNSVHPLLDYNSQFTPVPNDIYASPEHNFTIITGPNMGGKSIYIKQIAIMQIMAQLGCFLPATSAVLRLCDRVFSRIGFNDSVELNASTFVFEIKEMQHILKGLTKYSLVIIDELCRGTSTEEGTSIAWAICEELIMSDAFTFFTTHFMYLTRLQDLYFNVVNKHTAVLEEAVDSQSPVKRLVYQHKIEPGVNKIEHYGLALASKTNLPEDTVKLATELAELIARNNMPQIILTPQENDEQILYKLNSEIRHETRKDGNSEDITKRLLQKFKKENPQLIERLRVQRSRNNGRSESSANYSSLLSRRHESSIDSQNRPSISEPDRTINTRPNVVNSTSELSNNNEKNNSDKNVEMQYLRQESSTETSRPSNERFNRNSVWSKTIANLPPKVVYSTSDPDHETQINKGNDTNYTWVKSSKELLNTMNINDESIEDTDTEVRPSEATAQRETEINQPKTKFDASDLNNNISVTSNNLHSSLGRTEADDNDDQITLDDDNEEMSDSNSISDSDLADALTQIIEKCSADETLDVNRDSDISSDEELMAEAVNEINEDLIRGNSIENIVLTPPVDFRD